MPDAKIKGPEMAAMKRPDGNLLDGTGGAKPSGGTEGAVPVRRPDVTTSDATFASTPASNVKDRDVKRSPLRVRVPATSANIGPGFDSFGIAVSLYNEFSLGPPDGETTIADQALREFYRHIDRPFPSLKVRIDTCKVPPARGLGSSANLIVGALTLGNAHEGYPMTDDELLDLAYRIEGHPDNVAAAIFGGFIVTAMRGGRVLHHAFPLDEHLRFLAFIPDYRLTTREARAVLPANLSLSEAVDNMANAVMVALCFEHRRYGALKHFFKDYLHEPFREPLIRDYARVRSLEGDPDIYGTFISGAGPTMMAITGTNYADQLVTTMHKDPAWSALTILALAPDNEGYQVIDGAS